MKNNPKEITVHFGGSAGRRRRDNYLSVTVPVIQSDGSTKLEPILSDIRSDSASYTFSSPSGLLMSTQFAQPALTLLEKATFEDMRAKGLIAPGASFAGHSLGEYAALASMAQFMPLNRMLALNFYRGLSMQLASTRDSTGRTEYGMCAINPSRISKGTRTTCPAKPV